MRVGFGHPSCAVETFRWLPFEWPCYSPRKVAPAVAIRYDYVRLFDRQKGPFFETRIIQGLDLNLHMPLIDAQTRVSPRSQCGGYVTLLIVRSMK